MSDILRHVFAESSRLVAFSPEFAVALKCSVDQMIGTLVSDTTMFSLARKLDNSDSDVVSGGKPPPTMFAVLGDLRATASVMCKASKEVNPGLEMMLEISETR